MWENCIRVPFYMRNVIRTYKINKYKRIRNRIVYTYNAHRVHVVTRNDTSNTKHASRFRKSTSIYLCAYTEDSF